MNKFRRMNCK